MELLVRPLAFDPNKSPAVLSDDNVADDNVAISYRVRPAIYRSSLFDFNSIDSCVDSVL